MTRKLALVLSILTALSPLACSSAEVAETIGKAESAATSAGVGARTRYLGKDGACVEKGTNVCSFGFGATNPTEILTAVTQEQVELIYLAKPDFLFPRGGLAVKEAIPLDDQTTTALGLPTGTLVQPQFAPVTHDDGGPWKVSLSVGTVLVDVPNHETFDPPMHLRCCDDGQVKICRSCTGGSSNEHPPFRGSACCFNSIHFDPDIKD